MNSYMVFVLIVTIGILPLLHSWVAANVCPWWLDSAAHWRLSETSTCSLPSPPVHRTHPTPSSLCPDYGCLWQTSCSPFPSVRRWSPPRVWSSSRLRWSARWWSCPREPLTDVSTRRKIWTGQLWKLTQLYRCAKNIYCMPLWTIMFGSAESKSFRE